MKVMYGFLRPEYTAFVMLFLVTLYNKVSFVNIS